MTYTPHLISPIYKSVIRSVTDLIEEINTIGMVDPDIQYHNWEERSNEENLPTTTLIGTDGFSFDENDGLWIVRYSLAVSSYRDTNLLNEIDLLDFIHQKMGKGKKVKLREMVAGDEVNELMVSEFKVMPMGQSELRNYRTIGLELTRTGK